MTEPSNNPAEARHLDRSAAKPRDPRISPLPLLVLAAVAFFAVHPLIVHGPSCGHDFDFHILSWLEAATQIAHGNLHPHWAFTAAYNAGEPRFVFYPPLSWNLGALLGLLMPWTWTPIALTFLALAAAGWSCHRLLRSFVPAETALLISVLYMVNPYTLFTAYERTAYGELFAAAWLPLLLHAILRDRVTVPATAIPVALLWLSNAPAAVLGCYSLALLATVRLLLTLRKPHQSATPPLQLAANTAAGATLGIGLAGFFLLPAAYERRYIEQALTRAQSLLITDNFLFEHTADPDHDAVLHTASLLAVALLLATALALLIAFLRRPATPSPEARRTLIPLGVLTLTIAFLLIPASTPIWCHAPELAFLQFPWRFLAMLAPALALATALALNPHRTPPQRSPGKAMLVVTSAVIAVLTISSYYQFNQPCDPSDTVQARVALFHSSTGSDTTDDYTVGDADNDLLGKANPPFWLAPADADPNAAPPPGAPPGPVHAPFDLTSPTPETLILNLHSYPAWQITRNHQLVKARLERGDGLIAIPIPAGPSHIEIAYAHTRDETAGWILSAVSLVVLALLLLRRRRSR